MEIFWIDDFPSIIGQSIVEFCFERDLGADRSRELTRWRQGTNTDAPNSIPIRGSSPAAPSVARRLAAVIPTRYGSTRRLEDMAPRGPSGSPVSEVTHCYVINSAEAVIRIRRRCPDNAMIRISTVADQLMKRSKLRSGQIGCDCFQRPIRNDTMSTSDRSMVNGGSDEADRTSVSSTRRSLGSRMSGTNDATTDFSATWDSDLKT